MNSQISKNYAQALFNLALEKNLVQSIESIFNELVAIFEDNPDFLRFFEKPSVKIAYKIKAITELGVLLEPIGFRNFLKVLARNGRFHLFYEIKKEFHHLVNEFNGVKEGIVYSAFPLTDEQIKKLASRLESVEKSKIELEIRLQKDLIGGLKVVINDRVYSNNISDKIESLRGSLLHHKDNQSLKKEVIDSDSGKEEDHEN